MALINCNFFSYTLGMDTAITVLLPEKRQQRPAALSDRKYPVLYLLHGHSDDHTAFIRKSNIELLVRDKDLIVIMPNAHRSFYTNGVESHRYFDYLSEELPVVAANFFPASMKKEDNYIAGISMGGYGALKLALSGKHRYQAAASLSGALNPFQVVAVNRHQQLFTVMDFEENLHRIFGTAEAFQNSSDDLLALAAKKIKLQADIPELYQWIGEEDPLFASNQEFCCEAKRMGLAIRYKKSSGGHNWDFWNQVIPEMLQELGL